MEKYPVPAVEIEHRVIVSCNPSFLQLICHSANEVVGRELSAFSAKFAMDDGSMSASTPDVETDGDLQIVFLKPQGQAPVCVEMRVTQPAGLPPGRRIVTFQLLSAQKQKEQRQKDELYELVMKLWHVAVFDHDHANNKIYMSSLFREIYGIDIDDELTFETSGKFIHPEDMDPEAVMAAHDPRGDGRFNKAFRIIRKDGEIRWLHSRSQTFFGEVNGTMTSVRTMGAMVDFTEEYLLKAELQQNEQKLADILDSLPFIVLGVDKNGRITRWNKMAEKAIASQPPDSGAPKLETVFPMLQSEMPRIQDAMAQRTSLELLRLPDIQQESTFFYNVSITPVHNSRDFEAVVRIDDVSEQVRIEQMLVQSEKMLSVGGLAAGMAHEINNPLAAVIQSIQVVLGRLDASQKVNWEAAARNDISLDKLHGYLEDRKILRLLQSIGESANRAATIVNNMLGFVRVSNNRQTYCEMTNLVDTTLELALNDYDLKKKYDFRKIEIVREYESRSVNVVCDSGKIQQVLLNIIKNAGQAIFEAGIESPRLIVRIRKKDEYTRIEFEDNGPGVPDEISRRIFEPFFTTKPVGEGTGLGLSISYSIVTKEHKGRLHLEKGANGGARFVIELP